MGRASRRPGGQLPGKDPYIPENPIAKQALFDCAVEASQADGGVETNEPDDGQEAAGETRLAG
jgi:hypothetical protein